MRWMFAFTIMVLLAFAAFSFMIFLIKWKLKIKFLKSPPGIICDNVLAQFDDLQ